MVKTLAGPRELIAKHTDTVENGIRKGRGQSGSACSPKRSCLKNIRMNGEGRILNERTFKSTQIAD